MVKNSFRQAYITLGLLFAVVVIGSTGYTLLGFSVSEAIYQTIITIATVGFEEVHPLDARGMWFTMFLVIISIGIFAYAVSTFTRYIIEGVFRNTIKDNKVKRKIDKLSNHVVICGFGRNGSQAAQELTDHNVPIVVIENNSDLVQQLRDTPGMLYLDGDAGDEEVLKTANLQSARAMITTLPNDSDNLFVVLTAKEINPGIKIISRASAEHSDRKLKRAGATNVIMPDKIGGQRMAKLVAQPDVVEFLDVVLLQSAGSVVLEEVSCESLAESYQGKSIMELEIRGRSGANIIGLKRKDNTYLINPPPSTTLSTTDKLFALGTKEQLFRLVESITRDKS